MATLKDTIIQDKVEIDSGAENLTALGFSAGTGIYLANDDAIGISTNEVESLRITENGRLGIKTKDPTDKLQINGSLRCGSASTPQIITRLENGNANSFEFYFRAAKGAGVGTPVNINLVTISGLGNFHQAFFTVEYGYRSGSVGSTITRPVLRQYAMNRFVGNTVSVTQTHAISGDSTAVSRALITPVTLAANSYAIQIQFASADSGASFVHGVIRGNAVSDQFPNIQFDRGSSFF